MLFPRVEHRSERFAIPYGSAGGREPTMIESRALECEGEMFMLQYIMML